jgi:hypothetical protein
VFTSDTDIGVSLDICISQHARRGALHYVIWVIPAKRIEPTVVAHTKAE